MNASATLDERPVNEGKQAANVSARHGAEGRLLRGRVGLNRHRDAVGQVYDMGRGHVEATRRYAECGYE